MRSGGRLGPPGGGPFLVSAGGSACGAAVKAEPCGRPAAGLDYGFLGRVSWLGSASGPETALRAGSRFQPSAGGVPGCCPRMIRNTVRTAHRFQPSAGGVPGCCLVCGLRSLSPRPCFNPQPGVFPAAARIAGRMAQGVSHVSTLSRGCSRLLPDDTEHGTNRPQVSTLSRGCSRLLHHRPVRKRLAPLGFQPSAGGVPGCCDFHRPVRPGRTECFNPQPGVFPAAAYRVGFHLCGAGTVSTLSRGCSRLLRSCSTGRREGSQGFNPQPGVFPAAA